MIRAVVPVKAPGCAKQRMAECLTGEERSGLSLAMLEDVLARLCNHPAIASTLVISVDACVEEVAGRQGADFWTEAELGAEGLNNVVNAAALRLQGEGVESMMVVHSDLPLLRRESLDAMIRLHRNTPGPGVTISPDADELGSNLVLSSPPAVLPLAYGIDSFRRHQECARAAGVEVRVFRSDDTSRDIDRPGDLLELLVRGCGDEASYRFLVQSGIAQRLGSVDVVTQQLKESG